MQSNNDIKKDILNIKVRDQKIVVAVDEPQCEKILGDIIVTPPFGVTAKRMFSLSYFLTQNGFRVYRPDFRCHLGSSSGEITDARLSTQVDDILAVIKETNCSLVVALSLSTRAALRARRLCQKPISLVLVTPVVSIRSTLEAASGEDIFEGVINGRIRGTDILGNYVKNDFVKDCINSGFETWEDTLEDIISSDGHTTFIAGDRDPWVSFEMVQKVVQESLKTGVYIHLISMQAASHKINRNPAVANAYFEATTRDCLRIVGSNTTSVKIPDFKDIIKAIGEQRNLYRNAILSPWESEK